MKFNILFFLGITTIILITGCNQNSSKTNTNSFKQVDSIQINITKSKDKLLNDSLRFKFAKKANDESIKIQNDSLIAKSLLQLVKISRKFDNKRLFLKYYPQSISFSEKINDTLTKALTHNYTAYYFINTNNIDSAYYHFYNGAKHFKQLDKKFLTGKMLMNMAIIQKNKRDYIGSEKLSVEALEYLLQTSKKRYIASVYSNLGIVSTELKKFLKSIDYHKKALKIRKELSDKPILAIESMNSIAVAYKENNDLNCALIYFDSIKPHKSLLEKHPKTKVRVIDNIAHTKLLYGVDNNVLEDMNYALSIRTKENDLTGVMVSFLHLADYYRLNNESEKAFEFAKKAKNLSNNHQNYRDVLKALRILSTSKSKKNDGTFIEEYYKVSDSLEKEKNLISDHFARIRFESDQKEIENEQAHFKINKQEDEIKNRDLIIILLIAITLLVVSILFLLKRASKYRQEIYKEFNHRTRNNLVEIQRGVLKVKRSNNKNLQINELEGTTQSLLLLYSILEQNNHPTHVFIDDYLEKLAQSLILIYKDYKASIKLELTPLEVTSKQASLIGLIINEFLTNAFKHGFSKENENIINISCAILDNRKIKIIISLTGKQWSPESPKANGDGLKLMSSLSKKIPAKIKIYYKNKITSLNLTFTK